MPKYYIDIEFFQGQSKHHGLFPLLPVIIENEGKEFTLRELGDMAGIKSPQAAKHYLLQMMQHGLIYSEGKAYRLTKEAKKSIMMIPAQKTKVLKH